MGGSLFVEDLDNVYKKYPKTKKIKMLVETGTYKGDTCIPMSKLFDKVITIEIVKELYEYSKNKAEEQNITNIDFYLGDSMNILEYIKEEYKNGAIFFMDAHQSGPDTGNNGKIHVPLLEELEIILKNNILHSVFIFDDLRFFDSNINKPWDWKHISIPKILDVFEKYNYMVIDHYAENDRYFVVV